MWYREAQTIRLAEKYNNVMIALYPNITDAKSLAQDKAWFLREKSRSEYQFEPEKPEDIHLTLAILKTEWQYEDKKKALDQMLEAFASKWAPLDGKVQGLGYFSIPDGDAVYMSYDSPELPEFRQDLIDALHSLGVYEDQTHGFTPHMTLGYTTDGMRGQQIISMLGTREKVTSLFGTEIEQVGNFKARDLKLGKLVMRWGEDLACEHQLKLIQNK